jgi:hypothetical protein
MGVVARIPADLPHIDIMPTKKHADMTPNIYETP